MEIKDYHRQILEEIKLNSTLNGTSDTEELINYTIDFLKDSEEIEEFYYVPFEGTGKRGKIIQIYGYSYDELDNCLALYFCPGVTYGEIETLTNSEAEKMFSRVESFITEAQFIVDNAEESSPGYGLAYDIVHSYRNINKYKIYLLTDKVMSNKIKELKPSIINDKITEYNIWDLSRMHQLMQSGVGKEDIVIQLSEFVEYGLEVLPSSKTETYEAFLGNIPGLLLAKLYNKYGGRLLEGNVRSFLQTKGKINKGIRVTILNNPAMFFAYNNGIAATATAIKTETINNRLFITEITGLQIVNGGQTTASLANSLINDKKDNSEEQISKIYVPMKLSVVSQDKAQELIPNISRFANSQNKVSEADLWSNHPFHIRLEDYSRRTIAPAVDGKQYGTYWYYERANGQYKQETYKCTQSEKNKFDLMYPSSQMFKKIDVAKYWNIMELRPDIASAGGTKSFSRLATYISQQWEKDESVFNKDFFEKIISMGIIFKETDKIVKNQTWYNSYKANIVAYTISKIIFTVENNYSDFKIPFHEIWLKQTINNVWKKEIAIISKSMYDHLIDENRPVENVTEWAKREKCWEEAKKLNINLSESFIETLESAFNETQNIKDAKKDQKLSNSVEKMKDVVVFGSDNWKSLIQWNNNHRVLTPKEIELVKVAIKIEQGKCPSEKQCVYIMKILEHAREEGFPK